MPDSVYRVTEVIGTSEESWEAATRNAVETAARTATDAVVFRQTRAAYEAVVGERSRSM
jgi:flavin-binding protein dodecin